MEGAAIASSSGRTSNTSRTETDHAIFANGCAAKADNGRRAREAIDGIRGPGLTESGANDHAELVSAYTVHSRIRAMALEASDVSKGACSKIRTDKDQDVFARCSGAKCLSIAMDAADIACNSVTMQTSMHEKDHAVAEISWGMPALSVRREAFDIESKNGPLSAIRRDANAHEGFERCRKEKARIRRREAADIASNAGQSHKTMKANAHGRFARSRGHKLISSIAWAERAAHSGALSILSLDHDHDVATSSPRRNSPSLCIAHPEMACMLREGAPMLFSSHMLAIAQSILERAWLSN